MLGSLHAEMVALLEDREAPLYGRLTGKIELTHLDVASLLELLGAAGRPTPGWLLFLWTLFEGVPKYYRDAHERGVLGGGDRRALLDALFFQSSSPLRTEADTWFLRELRGRNDMLLKFVARHPGSSQAELEEFVRRRSGETLKGLATYLSALTNDYRLVERKQPVFAKPSARRGRYYLADNFLQSWLAALGGGGSAARQFRPVPQLIAEADERLHELEGTAFEKLVATLYRERSRKGLPGFALTRQIRRVLGPGRHRNRSRGRQRAGPRDSVRLLANGPRRSWRRTCPTSRGMWSGSSLRRKNTPAGPSSVVGLAPAIGPEHRTVLERHGVLPQDLRDLAAGLGPGLPAGLF